MQGCQEWDVSATGRVALERHRVCSRLRLMRQPAFRLPLYGLS
jgi:hypothetical protein